MRLNLGNGPHYEENWINVEVCRSFKADVYLDDPMILPFESESIDAVYAGHILEHIPWEQVPVYLDEIHRTLKPGKTLLIVGPDMWRGLNLWKQNRLDDDLHDILEWESLPGWDAPRHYWNCSEKRMLKILEPIKWKTEAVKIDSNRLNPWPVVSRVDWQMAVFAVKNGSRKKSP